MRHPLAMLWLGAAAISVAAPGIAWRRYSQARGDHQAQAGRLSALRAQDQELRALRGPAARPQSRGGDANLTVRLTTALGLAGLPASTLGALTPQSQPLAGPDGIKATKHTAAVTLAPVTLPTLGGFLQSWRDAQPGWVISAIEVSPDPSVGAVPGADLPLRVNLTIESLSPSDPGEPS